MKKDLIKVSKEVSDCPKRSYEIQLKNCDIIWLAVCVPVNHPSLIGIVLFFESKTLKNQGIPIFKREKRHFDL